ncbi:MAG: NADH-quinone oxidoreductase subunit M [Chloroherpetonaceae bacterium]|nr:NADH-quinone oxidoreductase subunit M [Chloroherpetonaceae bacterium]
MSSLTIIIFLPFLLSIPLFLFRRNAITAVRIYASGVSLLTLSGSLHLALQFNPDAGFQFQHIALEQWLGTSADVKYSVALDGLSLSLFVLTAIMFAIATLLSWSIETSVREYFFFLLTLETCILGIFSAIDLFLYYIFWEAMLIPMYFLIGMWGGKRRAEAATKFLLYMLTASLVMLVGVIYLGYLGRDVNGGIFTTDYQKLTSLSLPIDAQQILFWIFGLSFFVKSPIFPLHTWAADVYAESPLGTVLTGLLLKVAPYALIRFNVMLFPEAAAGYAPLIGTLAVITILYGALVAAAQAEMKRVLAFSSVSHLGFMLLGIFAFTEESLQGALLQMLHSSLSTGLLFLVVDRLEAQFGWKEMHRYGGLKAATPFAASAFLFAMLASVALPGLSGFVGEFLILTGSFKSAVLGTGLYAVLAAIGVILAVVYMLPMTQKIFFGKLSETLRTALDFNWREKAVAAAMILLMLWIGLAPSSILRISVPVSRATIEHIKQPQQAQSLQHSTKP